MRGRRSRTAAARGSRRRCCRWPGCWSTFRWRTWTGRTTTWSPSRTSVAAQPGTRVRVRFAGRLVNGFVAAAAGASRSTLAGSASWSGWCPRNGCSRPRWPSWPGRSPTGTRGRSRTCCGWRCRHGTPGPRGGRRPAGGRIERAERDRAAGRAGVPLEPGGREPGAAPKPGRAARARTGRRAGTRAPLRCDPTDPAPPVALRPRRTGAGTRRARRFSMRCANADRRVRCGRRCPARTGRRCSPRPRRSPRKRVAGRC